MKNKELVYEIVKAIAVLCLRVVIVRWGWSILAPHLNAPMFTYWEMFGIYWAFQTLAGCFKTNIE